MSISSKNRTKKGREAAMNDFIRTLKMRIPTDDFIAMKRKMIYMVEESRFNGEEKEKIKGYMLEWIKIIVKNEKGGLENIFD